MEAGDGPRLAADGDSQVFSSHLKGSCAVRAKTDTRIPVPSLSQKPLLDFVLSTI